MDVTWSFRDARNDQAPPVSLDIQAGQMTALVVGSEGVNRMVLEAVALLSPPDEGVFRLRGVPAGSVDAGVREAYHASLGVVSLQLPLISNLKLIENLYLPYAYHRNTTEAAAFDRAYGILDEFGLSGKFNMLPAYLSNFERRMAMLARASLMDAELLFVSLPFKEVDPRHRAALLGRIEAHHHARPGRTTVLTFIGSDDITNRTFDAVIEA